MWEKASDAAVNDLSGRVESGLLTDGISVASQTKDPNSLLRTYYEWTKARNTVPALASGKMSRHGKYNENNTADKTVAAWYMTATDGSKALVLHNVGSSEKTVSLPDDKLSEKAISLGSVKVSGTDVTLGANSSAVFLQ